MHVDDDGMKSSTQSSSSRGVFFRPEEFTTLKRRTVWTLIAVNLFCAPINGFCFLLNAALIGGGDSSSTQDMKCCMYYNTFITSV